jgi:thiol-disulfide isomerase/thioredoxin
MLNPTTTSRLPDLGAAPELTGITDWLNAAPLTLASLRGKVVLLEFWTFACGNCQNVQPHVQAWHERYAADGLVVLGVHTPELAFERDLGNVRRAVERAGLKNPIVIDADFATWDAFGNRYWPAFYFIDKRGRVRHTRFGEGDYARSEAVIRELLAEPA